VSVGGHGLGVADCDLIAQFERDVLPLFAVRDERSSLVCRPEAGKPTAIDLAFLSLQSEPGPGDVR